MVPSKASPAYRQPCSSGRLLRRTVNVAKMKLARQLRDISLVLPTDTHRHTSNDVPKIKKNRIGPATSLSSMMCWSIRPNGFRTARVYNIHQLRSTGQSSLPTFICICLKFTPNSSTMHCQLGQDDRGVDIAYVAVALQDICSKLAMPRRSTLSTYPSVPNAASHPVRSPSAPMPICPLTPGAEKPAPYCAGYAWV